MARAAELSIPLVEPDEFSYVQGKGVKVNYRGEEILVGSRALFIESGIRRILPIDDDEGAGGASHVYVTVQGRCSGAFELRMSYALKPRTQSRPCARWEYERFC